MGWDCNAYLFYGFPIEKEILRDNDSDYNPVSYCNIRSYGTYGMDLYFIAITKSIQRSYKYECAKIEILEKHPEWDGQLRQYCSEKGIPWQEPSWYITSIFG